MNSVSGRSLTVRVFGILILFVSMIAITGCGSKEADDKKPNDVKLSGHSAADDFITLYPGVYTEKEKALVEKYIADNKALETGAAVRIKALVNEELSGETPGAGPRIEVTERMVRYFNEMRDPDNPLYTDSDYARAAGFEDIIAYPAFAAHDDSFMVPYPTAARDTLLVADLIHSNTFYQPVYPGDILYLVNNSRSSNLM